jgi:hypothetical protein
LFIRCCLAALVVACHGTSAPPPAEVHSASPIELDEDGKVVARVVPGHPCRATVAGVELLVGGPPLIAQYGDTKWTAETKSNGTTFLANDRAVARIHANQLFDPQGIPLIKVLDDGGIVNGPGRLVRRAKVATQPVPRVVIEDLATHHESSVTGTQDIALAGLLAAPEASAEVRALTACHLLQGSK